MVRDILLKDCMGGDHQTASGYRDDVIRRIRDMLCATSRRTISKADRTTLQIMLQKAEALKDQGMSEEVLLEKFSDIAKEQHKLKPETRRDLARVIPWLPTQWMLDPESRNCVIPNDWSKVIVAAAELKILLQLEPLSAKEKILSQAVDIISDEVAELVSPMGQTVEARKWKSQNKKIANRKSNFNAQENASSKRTTGRPKRGDNVQEFIGDKNGLRMNILNVALPSRLVEYAERFKRDFGNTVPSVLFIPIRRTVRLDGCLKILDRGFLMPKQLRQKTEQLEYELQIPGAFEDINRKIMEYEQTLLALATEEAMTAFVFDQPQLLANLHYEVEEIVCSSFKTKKKRSNRDSQVPANEITLVEDIPASAPSSFAEYNKETHKSCRADDEEVLQIRNVTVSRWCFKTRLCDSALNKLLEGKMDAGTFPDAWHSAAYHVNKHAPGMLVEDYLREAENLLTNCWIGQLEKRFTKRSFEQNTDHNGDENLWAKAVYCSQGSGCYSWAGRTIWYHPPDRLL